LPQQLKIRTADGITVRMLMSHIGLYRYTYLQ